MSTKIKPLNGYAWKITKVNKSVLSESDKATWNWSDPKVDVSSIDEVDWSDAVKFKLYDDDKNWYASGLYVGPDDESLFAPLDDWGMPGLGCTYMEIKDKQSGRWDVL